MLDDSFMSAVVNDEQLVPDPVSHARSLVFPTGVPPLPSLKAIKRAMVATETSAPVGLPVETLL